MDCRPPDSSAHGILQARILVAIPFSRGSSWSRDQTWVSCIAGRYFSIWATRKAQSESHSVMPDSLWLQGLYSPPGSSVHWLLHTGILEWVAIPFSRGFSQSRVPTQVSCIADRFFTIWACYKSWDYLKFQHISKAWVQILFVILSSDPTTLYTLHI